MNCFQFFTAIVLACMYLLSFLWFVIFVLVWLVFLFLICMCNVAISTVLMYCFVTLVRLSLVTNKGYLLTYLLNDVSWWDVQGVGFQTLRGTFVHTSIRRATVCPNFNKEEATICIWNVRKCYITEHRWFDQGDPFYKQL